MALRKDVEHDLAHGPLIGDNIGEIARHGLADDHAATCRCLLQHLDGIVGRVAQIDRREIKLKLPGLDFRKIEQVVDQREEQSAAGMNVIHIAAVLVVLDLAKALQPHDFRETHDGVERRAQFMADAGQEFRLLPAGGLGHFLGLAQFGFGPFPLGDVAHHGAEGGALR